jgi:hypothetical protein
MKKISITASEKFPGNETGILWLEAERGQIPFSTDTDAFREGGDLQRNI